VREGWLSRRIQDNVASAAVFCTADRMSPSPCWVYGMMDKESFPLLVRLGLAVGPAAF